MRLGPTDQMHIEVHLQPNPQGDLHGDEGHFNNIVNCILCVFKEQNIADIKCRLHNLPIQRKKQHKECLAEVVRENTVENVWCKLSNYWNFLNYSLVEHLANTFGDKPLQDDIQGYKRNLESFRCKTRVCVFAYFYNKDESIENEAVMKLRVKLKENWEKWTLQDLENWKGKITEKLFLPNFVMKLESVEPGCISITWTIPCVFVTALVKTMDRMDMEDFHRQLHIMSMTIDDEQCGIDQCCQSKG